ncbi:MAG: asparaginase [Propionibacteriaceae bacterium]
MTLLPHIVVLGTGGTIAGSRCAATDQDYAAAISGVEALLDAVPELSSLARLSAEQLFQLDSVEMDLTHMIALARRVDELLKDDDVDAVVITHGTDTMEESAFLLHLVINSDKPVVFLGSMRPADAISADGPDNLLDAVAVAAHPTSRNRGVLVVFDDQVHSARDVTKVSTTRTDAFRSPHGALAEVVEGAPRWVRGLTRRHTTTSAFNIDDLAAMPRVEVIMTHPEMPLELLDALAAAGTKGVIHIGAGNGNISTPVMKHLDYLASRGMTIVRASQVHTGIVTRNGAVPDDKHGFVAADDHNPAHARLLLALALTETCDSHQIQQLFWTH